MEDKQEYDVDKTTVHREGRTITLQTWTDISPEIVLMEKAQFYIRSYRMEVSIGDEPIAATWRKRLAHVLEN